MTYPKNKIVSLDRIFKFTDIEAAIDKACKDITNPRSQGCPRFQSEEELANNVGKINAYYSL